MHIYEGILSGTVSGQEMLIAGAAAAGKCSLSGLVIVVGLVWGPAPILAHGIDIDARVRGTMEGQARYHDGTPVRDATVTASDPAGKEIGRTTTDRQGKFMLKARFRCDHRLLVDTGDGHGAERTIAAAQLPPGLPPRGDVPVSPTTNDESYGQRPSLRDVLSGIGYIVGVPGIAFYFLGIRRRRSRPPD